MKNQLSSTAERLHYLFTLGKLLGNLSTTAAERGKSCVDKGSQRNGWHGTKWQLSFIDNGFRFYGDAKLSEEGTNYNSDENEGQISIAFSI